MCVVRLQNWANPEVTTGKVEQVVSFLASDWSVITNPWRSLVDTDTTINFGYRSRGKETWPTITLGNCNGEKFPTEARTTVTNLNEATLELTLNKKGRDNMQIQEFYINTQNQNGVSRR